MTLPTVSATARNAGTISFFGVATTFSCVSVFARYKCFETECLCIIEDILVVHNLKLKISCNQVTADLFHSINVANDV